MRQEISAIRAGDAVKSTFLLGAASLQQSRNGPYWRLELKDKTGSLEAKIWSPLSASFSDLAPGMIVEVAGKAGQFREQVQLTVEGLRVLDLQDEALPIDVSDFLPTSARKPEDMLADIEALCRKEFTHKPWRKFVQAVLDEPTLRARLLVAPAAKSVHHAYVGGLLEHMLSVAGLCMKMADHYPDLDRQTLLAGALLHDIGKLEEMSGGLANDYTDAGRLMGHLSQGLLMLEPYLKKSGLEPELALHFRHLLLSHHGEPEFGTVRQPATAEAFVLHFADNTDAKVAQCRSLLNVPPADSEPAEDTEEDPPRNATMIWTPWQNLLGRSLCLPPRTPAPAGKEKKKAESPKAQESNQCSLL